MNSPCRMDIEGRVVGSGSVVGTEGVVQMAVLAVISHHKMNIEGRIVGSGGVVSRQEVVLVAVLTVIGQR